MENLIKIIFFIFLSNSFIYAEEKIDSSKMMHDFLKEYVDFIEKNDKTSTADLKEKTQDVLKKLSSSKEKFVSEKKEVLENIIKKHKENFHNLTDEQSSIYFFNYSLALFLLSQIDKNQTKNLQEEALKKIDFSLSNFPHNKIIDQSYYLKALILEAVGNNKKAQDAWSKVTQIKKPSIYKFLAFLAIGDFYFHSEKINLSFSEYKKAAEFSETFKELIPKDLLVKSLYRLMWASYLSGNFLQAVETGKKILFLKTDGISQTEVDLLYKDTSKVMARALIETKKFSSILKDIQSLPTNFIGKISVDLMHRWQKENNLIKANDLAQFITDNYPLIYEAPLILSQQASNYKLLGKTEKHINSLEKLALLLPKNSLWHTSQIQFDNLPSIIALMQSANKEVYNWYFTKGMVTANPKDFLTSHFYLKILLESPLNADDSLFFHLKSAECLFKAHLFSDALSEYQAIQNKFKLTENDNETILYQIAKANEFIWRNKFQDAVQRKTSTNTSEFSLLLKNLSDSVSLYAEKFQESHKTHELLLSAATAYKTHEKWLEALYFWQKIILTSEDEAQRAKAIRGIVYAYIKQKNYKDLIITAKNFIKLDTPSINKSYLREELLEVLSAALKEEMTRYAKNGTLSEAADVYTEISLSFPDIPEREHFIKEAGYLYATDSEFTKLKNLSEIYLNDPSFSLYRADFSYLLAKSYFHLFSFKKAAETYLDFAEKNKKHTKAAKSFLRSAEIFSALGMPDKAVHAFHQHALYGDKKNFKHNLLLAYKEALIAKDYTKALDLINNSITKTTTSSEHYEFDYYAAQALILSGKKNEATKKMQDILKEIRTSGFQKETWKKNLMSSILIDLIKIKKENFFDSPSINDFSLEKKQTIFSEISKIYEELITYGNTENIVQGKYIFAIVCEKFAQDIFLFNNQKKSSPEKTLSRAKYGEKLQKQSLHIFSEIAEFNPLKFSDAAVQASLYEASLRIKNLSSNIEFILPQEILSETPNDIDEKNLQENLELISDNPKETTSYVALAQYFLTKNHTTIAEFIANEACKKNKNDAALLNILAILQEKNEQIEIAKNLFLSIKDTHVPAMLNLSRIYFMEKNWETSSAETTKALALRPSSWQGLLLLGLIQEKQGLDEKAEKSLQKAVELSQTHVEARYDLALFYIKKSKNLFDAQKLLNDVLQNKNTNKHIVTLSEAYLQGLKNRATL